MTLFFDNWYENWFLGKMQGIGSDPIYNPNSQSHSSALPIDPTEVANNALSFVNTVWETTSKVL